VVGTTAKETGLCEAALPLSVIVDCIDGSDGDTIHLLDCFLNLNLVGLAVNDESVTVQLFALNRHLLSYDWLNYDTHLLVLLGSRGKDVLYAVDENELVGVHDGVGVDFVNGDDPYLREVTG